MPYTTRFPAIAAAAQGKATAAVQKAVLDIETGAKARSRVDTGAMKGGWEGQMTGPNEGIVSNGVEYAIYNEFGTRHMPAQPMLTPATEEARPGFEAAIRTLFS